MSSSEALTRQSVCDPSPRFAKFLADFDAYENFAFSKINHGFWEALAQVSDELGWPIGPEQYERADAIAKRNQFFAGGFVPELLRLLERAGAYADPALDLNYGLSAWPNDNRIIGTPFEPHAGDMMRRCVPVSDANDAGLMLKEAIHDGSFSHLLARLRDHSVIVVGPEFLKAFGPFARLDDCVHIPIHQTEARQERDAIERAIEDKIAAAERPPVVLLQAGTLAPYWLLRLRARHGQVRWIDGGLALSICHPPDILRRPWGRVYRRQIVRFYNGWTGQAAFDERHLESLVAKALSNRVPAQEPKRGVDFIENKTPDLGRVAALLETCRARNQWANGGPLFEALGESYARYMNLPRGVVATPCANAGMALEALARHHEKSSGRRLRWVVSAFSFANLARGYFAAAKPIDCDETGMLDIEGLRGLDPDSYDGFVVTNLFGLWRDFSAYIAFARASGKFLLIDNAAGVGAKVPPWPYQVFSLHQTKPFGAGEGGLFLSPAGEQDEIFALLDYRPRTDLDPAAWVNNGKLSDIACAYHLDRLERSPEWLPLYAMQAARIRRIATRSGLTPLFPFDPSAIATSQPYLTARPNVMEERQRIPDVTLGKYYKPLASRPRTMKLYQHIVNVPCHPDMAMLDGERLSEILRGLGNVS